jgi:cyclophilin family peptidyl-prolyl cis-trans isomerase
MNKSLLIVLITFLTLGIGYSQVKKTAVKPPTSYKTGPKKTIPTKTTAKKGIANATNSKSNTNALADGIFAEMKTNKGLIILQLEYQKAPVTVANFVSLVEGNNPQISEIYKGKPFYDGLKFHRVISNFMIQGGDPSGNGSGSAGYAFKDEFDPTLVHDKAGIVSMANSGPKTNSSQFFITHKETPWLNNKHSVFGRVISGMEVVNAIAQDDIIEKVTIKRVGIEAKKFNAPKVFANYYASKAEEDKKQDAVDAENRKKQAGIETEYRKKQILLEEEAKKNYMVNFGTVVNQKSLDLQNLKTKSTSTPSGLSYVITKKGMDKTPANGSKVFIHYAGYLEDGTLFDSSIEEVTKAFGKFDASRANANGYMPMEATCGSYQFVPGFSEGLNLMHFGEKATLYIPSNLGYGAKGAGNVIPPNANIIFEVELLEAMPKK